MRNRAAATAAAIVVACAAIGFAQAKPDFSGTWTLDPSRSELGGGGSGPGGPGPGGRGGRMGAVSPDATFVIKQTPTELVIDVQTGATSQVSTVKLDGSESVNTGPRGGQIKSKARWEGDKLIVERSQSMNTPAGDMTLQTTEVRSLAADGTMTVERTTQTPRGTRSQKLVFKKKT